MSKEYESKVDGLSIYEKLNIWVYYMVRSVGLKHDFVETTKGFKHLWKDTHIVSFSEFIDSKKAKPENYHGYSNHHIYYWYWRGKETNFNVNL